MHLSFLHGYGGAAHESALLPAPQTRSARFDRFKTIRDQRAAEFGIDPTLIASKQTLGWFSRCGIEVAKLLLNWQRGLMGL